MTRPTPKPSEIYSKKHFWNAFDQSETEVSARWIVRYMQDVEERTGKCWPSFTYEQINGYYTLSDGFTFNRLLGYRNKSTQYIEVDNDGNMTVTANFIGRCHRSGASNE